MTDSILQGAVAAPAKPAARWGVLFVAWFSFLLTFVDRLAWGNVAIEVGHGLSLPLAALGVFVTAFYVGYVVSNAIGGVACDRLGPRATLTVTLVALAASTFLFSFTSSVAWGLAAQAVMGLSAGANPTACVKLMMMWFGKLERGRAMGLLTSATSLGVVVANATVPTLTALFGWQGVYRVLGLVTLSGAVLAWVVLGRRPPALEDGPKAGAETSIRDLVANRNLLLLAAAGFGAMWGTWGFAFWANALMIRGYHVSAVEAGAIVSMFGIGAVFAKPLIGLLSDWLGGDRKKPLVIGCFLGFSVVLILFGHADSIVLFRWLAPFLGVFAFVYTPLMFALIGEAAGVARAGAATGFTNAIWQIGSVIVPSVVGLLYQASGSFSIAFLALAVGPFLAAVCMLFVTETRAAPHPPA
jgi:sugar phosphate permease